MTREQYLEQVSDLLKLQVEKKLVFTDEKIEEFKKLKPVSLGVQFIEVLNSFFQGKTNLNSIYDFEKEISITSDYPHLKEVLEAIEKIYLENNKVEDVERIAFTRSFVENDIETFASVYDKLELLCKAYINNPNNGMDDIIRLLYILEDASALIILGKPSNDYRKWFEEPNMGFLMEELENKDSKFVLIANESNECLVELIARVLDAKGNKVFLFKNPLCYENEQIEIKDTVSISVENIQKSGDMTIIHPIKIVSPKKGEMDNVSYLLEYINNHYNDGGHLNVLGQGYQISELSIRPFTNKKMTRLSQFYFDKREYNLTLARYGDYLEYFSKVYKEDCKALLYKKPTKKFSIVVPARDSADTLQYTIKTCLEQTYTGEYEIVISDNSVKNTEVYEFCKALNNPKINYVKTPRNLSLAKSFEFAYLHTNGEFIFSIGSDDGVLPWALEALEIVREKYPQDGVIAWPRGFYAWPGFNYGQQHQFSIPNNAKKEQFVVYYENNDVYLQRILDNPSSMYSLPLLYINSGFSREYLQMMYNMTGELFDGNSQDLYMGIEMIALNDKILNITLPLTMAGMSSRSVGATFDKIKNLQMKSEQRQEMADLGSVGMNVQTTYEHLVPFLRSDVSALYYALMRAISKGLFSPQIIKTKLDWEKIFTDIVESLRPEHITYYDELYKTRYAASLHGETFLQWFDETLFYRKMTLCMVDEEVLRNLRNRRTYTCGLNQFGGGTWDASEFGVQNIHDAVKLYCDLIADR